MAIISITKNLSSVSPKSWKFIVQYHDRRHRPYIDYKKGSFVANTFQSESSLIGYRKTVVKYKSTPKGKTCTSVQNREQCVEECKINDFIMQRQTFPGRYLADHDRIDQAHLRFSQSLEYLAFNVSKGCSERCSHLLDCYKEYYMLVGSNQADNQPDSDAFAVLLGHIIIIEYPSHPTTFYEISLKMTFEEYLCLIASIVSLWFGFSILLFTEICPKIFNKILVINQKKNINVNLINPNLIIKGSTNEPVKISSRKQELSVNHH